MRFEVLTVHHYSENLEEEKRVTLSPGNILVVAAAVEDIQIRGRSLREVSVLLTDGESADLIINHSDLEKLEKCVGSYCLD